MILIAANLFFSTFLPSFHLEAISSSSEENRSTNLSAIVETINLAYEKQPFNRKDVPRITESSLNQLLSDPQNQLFYTLSEEGKIGSTLLLKGNELSLFAVHPQYQGQKIGSLLLKEVEKEAFKTYDSVLLKVIPLFQESLIRYYESLGYQSYEEYEPLSEEKLARIDEKYHDQVFALILRKSKNSHPKELKMSQEQLLPFSLQARSIVEGKIYEHYKGLRYQILHVGRHSETLEEMIVYQALYGEKEIWIRPLEMFLEEVVINGVLQPRFKEVLSKDDSSF